MNTPKTVESLINEAETKWASQGRTDEQKWAVRNFITGSMQEAITALNELIRNERIGELEIQPLFSDKVEQAEYENNRIAELRAEERLQK